MSGSNNQKRQGLEVVKVSQIEGRRYEVDEEALASVLLRPDVRSLPVVVVSVAGAYRGGKSFILDFFLRYLTAPRSSQLSGEWLGQDDELLEGFDWRGGCEANTKGIHIWPEPILATIEPSGEKVVIILMDTQGTFDSESDMGDNSAIFALSTLLSSVQLYNIRGNIGEDDLQHLQLFTEYGKLACDIEGKAFQTLHFLVRDWMHPYEYPNGYTGGDALLTKRLTPKPNQKKQLREVREHIHSCFEKLLCFLMPHPGLAVADERFKGRLCDISESFRQALLELIPSLFDLNKLTPKIINGESVQAQSLFEYFKQYVGIFNSDDLPEATTIFQATVDACMMSALREARGHYENKMEVNIVEDQSVSTSLMWEWHNAAVTAAIDYFKYKKKFGSQENVDTYLEDLRKELEARLSLYLRQNDAKLRATISLAKNTYEECVAGVCGSAARVCLHARELSALHARAACAALAGYVRARALLPRDRDEQKDILIKYLEDRRQYLYAENEQNNRTAILEAREIYLSNMKYLIGPTGVSTDVLRSQHEKFLTEAIDHFHSCRNRPSEESDDSHLERLEQIIAENFMNIDKNNMNTNMWALEAAQCAYNIHVSTAWGPRLSCVHPHAFVELHHAAREIALNRFVTDRVESECDSFKDQLIANLEIRYKELLEINRFNNMQAVDKAFDKYTLLMDCYSAPSLTSILIAPFILKMYKLTTQHHESARNAALELFAQRRRGGTYDVDTYLIHLEKKIARAFEDYKNVLRAIIKEFGF